jgi:hypothetical protein
MTRTISADADGAALAKYAIAIGICKGDEHAAQLFATAQYGGQPGVEYNLATQIRGKSAVPGGGLASQTWAGNLVPGSIDRDLALLFSAESALTVCEGRARRVAFLTATGTVAAAGPAPGNWRAGGAATRLNAPVMGRASALVPTAADVLIVVSNELLKANDPDCEAQLRTILVTSLASRLDYLFLDPSVAASAPFPASITNGATEINFGSPAAPSAGDLDTMLRSISTPGGGLTWIASPQTLARAIVAVGRNEPAGLFCGLPCIKSGNAPAGLLVLVDLNELHIAAGGYDLEFSKAATVQMDSAPTMNSITPTGGANVSFFQAGVVGYRFGHYVNWFLAHSGACSYASLGV